MTTRQGAYAESLVISWLYANGFNAFTEPNNNSEIDIIAEINHHLIPLQVKSTLETTDNDSMKFDIRVHKDKNLAYSVPMIFVFVCIENGYIGCDLRDGGKGVEIKGKKDEYAITKERLMSLNFLREENNLDIDDESW